MTKQPLTHLADYGLNPDEWKIMDDHRPSSHHGPARLTHAADPDLQLQARWVWRGNNLQGEFVLSDLELLPGA